MKELCENCATKTFVIRRVCHAPSALSVSDEVNRTFYQLVGYTARTD